MFSAIRRRIHLSPATVIAGLALVFAMTGGAYAAKKYLITSTKQISPSVLKSLRGKAGPAGANGAPGAQGAQGPAGPAGAAGAKGDAGAPGAKGQDGAPGAKGATGSQGATGATGAKGTTGFTETLPSEKTETGTWGARTAGAQTVFIPISFAIPVDPAPTLVYVLPEESKSAEGCPGIAPNGLPTAAPGKLCVYAGFASPELVPSPAGGLTIEEEEQGSGIKASPPGTGPAGTVLSFACAGICGMNGAWAVTAE
jgi:hypothetical protein